MIRNQCDCYGQKHQLVNNCLTCGRIVCKLEGEGPCVFCGNPVFKKRDQIFNEEEFPDIEQEQALKQALQHKDKLLDFNRKEIHQTNIIDDQLDYYQIADNIWESQEVRDQAVMRILKQEQEIEKSKIEYLNEYDIETNQYKLVKVEEKDTTQYREEAQQFIKQVEQSNRKEYQGQIFDAGDKCLEIHQELKKKLAQYSKQQPQVSCTVAFQNDDYYVQFQEEVMKTLEVKNVPGTIGFDNEFFNVQDAKLCLSMHQPWAQLVVDGFKRIEGREWVTTYKGPLWIHAGAKKPEPEEISYVESQYEALYKNNQNRPKLPPRYPTGALIGVVDFIGVLKKDKYNSLVKENQREDGDTEYKFIFRNPRKLAYPIKMKGQNHLFKLDDTIRAIALKSLQMVPSLWTDYLIEPHQCDEIKLTKRESEFQQEQAQKEHEFEISDIVPQAKLSKKQSQVQKQEKQENQDKQEIKPNSENNQQYQSKIVQNQQVNSTSQSQYRVLGELGWGFLIGQILDQQQLQLFADYCQQYIGKQAKGKKTHKQVVSFSKFAHRDKLTQVLLETTQIFFEFDNSTIYYMKPDDKGNALENPRVLICIGGAVNVDIQVDRISLKQGQVLIFQEGQNNMDIKINLDKNYDEKNSLLEEMGQAFSFKSWLVEFK